MPDINVPLLRKGLEHITAHPGEHMQEVWLLEGECGTVGCLAGHVALIEGATPAWDKSFALVESRCRVTAIVRDADGVAWPVQDFAQDRLGLTDDQAHGLFHGDNTLRRMWCLASQYTQGAINPPPGV